MPVYSFLILKFTNKSKSYFTLYSEIPKADKDPLIEVNSYSLISFSSWDKYLGILYFSLPAKSTIFIEDMNYPALFLNNFI